MKRTHNACRHEHTYTYLEILKSMFIYGSIKIILQRISVGPFSKIYFYFVRTMLTFDCQSFDIVCMYIYWVFYSF